MNRPNFELPPPPSPRHPPASGFWLGFISLLVGITLIGPPLSVLYDMNDECLRTTSAEHEHGIFATLYEVPPLSVPRFTYFAVRTAVLAGSLNALLLCVIGVLTIRSRSLGTRLLAINSVAHVLFMIAMAWAAYRFSTELDAATAKRIATLGTPFGSSVKRTAIWAALPGIVYPLVLLSLFARHRRSNERRRLVR
jgi:hypothetical protein